MECIVHTSNDTQVWAAVTYFLFHIFFVQPMHLSKNDLLLRMHIKKLFFNWKCIMNIAPHRKRNRSNLWRLLCLMKGSVCKSLLLEVHRSFLMAPCFFIFIALDFIITLIHHCGAVGRPNGADTEAGHCIDLWQDAVTQTCTCYRKKITNYNYDYSLWKCNWLQWPLLVQEN